MPSLPGVVARERGEVVGAAAVEPYGPAGLLRSVVVEPALRGTGIGGTLVDSSEMLARDLGIDELYLLTETAETWFERRGYRAIERDVVPEPVRGSIEFTTACSTTAVAMWRALGSVTGARRAGSQWWNDAIPARAMTAISPRRNAAATMTGSDAAKPDGRTADLLLVSATRLTRLPESRGFASPGHPGFAFVDQLRWPAHTWCAR